MVGEGGEGGACGRGECNYVKECVVVFVLRRCPTGGVGEGRR